MPRRLLPVLLLAVASQAFPQALPLDSPLPVPGVRYDPAIPKPEDVLGVRIGTRHLRSHEVNDFFRAVANRSDRVRVISQGRSWEGRELIHAVVSTPRNLSRLAEIQKANRRIFEAPLEVSDQELSRMPLVVWMGYGVHGNEASVCEAAVLTLYHLAAGRGKPVEDVLENCVVIIAPNYNPDGRDRFANWANHHRGQNPTADPQDRERQEPWPGGRMNHYWFDLNRDWLPLSQPESQLRHAHWTAWRPQITLDYHEMGSNSTYYFPPGVPKRTNPLTLPLNQELHRFLAGRFATSLEAVGETYFTSERFDDFYPGKGSTYPDLIGSVGILFEQAGTRSVRLQTPRRELTFPITIRNQVATGIAALQAAVDGKARFLAYQREAFRDGVSRKAPFAGVQFANDEAGRALVRVLMRHEIRVYRRDDYYVVPTRQPLSRLVESVFAREKQFEDNQFYDVSAWNLDLAFGIDAKFLDTLPELLMPAPGVPEFEWEAPTVQERTLGLVLDGRAMGFFGALNRVLSQGIRGYLVRRQLGEAGQPGSLFIPLQQDGKTRREIVDAVFAAGQRFQTSVSAVAGQTGEFVSWGGENAILLPAPKIALVVGAGTDPYGTGEAWHLLDALWGVEVTLLDAERLSTANLRDVTTLVLGGGSYPTAAVEALRTYMAQGGRVVALNTAVDWVSTSQLWSLTSVRHTPRLADLPYGQISAERGRHSIPGTILWAEVDTTHPLGLGVPSRLPLFKDSSSLWRTPETPGTTVARFAANPLASGYLSSEVAALVPGTAAILARREGRGELILFPDSPHFRAFHRAGNRIFGNAVFWGLAF